MTSRLRRDLRDVPVAVDLDAGGAVAVQQDAVDVGAGDQREVLAPQHRVQVGDRRRAAHPAALGDLIPAHAVLLGAVEVVVGGKAGLQARLHERLTRAVAAAVLAHSQRSAGAVQLTGPALVVLGADEVREHVIPAPALEAHGGPTVVVGAVAADVDHRVDRRRATEGPPARQVALPAGEAGLGVGDERPVVLARRDREDARRKVDLVGGVGGARLQQAHRHVRVLGQACGKHTTSRAGTGDHVVIGHWAPSQKAWGSLPFSA